MMKVFHWTMEAERLWNEQAGEWHERSRNMWENGSRKEIIHFFQKFVIKGAKVCDLGCGDGYGTFKLVQAGYKVTGVDISSEMLNKAAIINKGNSARFVKGELEKLPFGNQQFDAVLAINSLEWTENPLRALAEMKRILKDGGKACVGMLGPTAGPRKQSFPRLYGKRVICNTMMPWEFERLALENGWEKVDELTVFKKDALKLPTERLSGELRQALSFMHVFMLEKK